MPHLATPAAPPTDFLDDQFASIQFASATPVAFYTDISARCWCESTIILRTDGTWWHGARIGVYCRESAGGA